MIDIAIEPVVQDFYVPPTLEQAPLGPTQKRQLKDQIKHLLHAQNAVMITHYYTDPDIQQITEQTGGFIGDSLAMAQFGVNSDAQTLVVAGVKFMGESAKILNPEKRVLMPTLEATCSLDLGCPINEFSAFCDAHPDRTVVVYANTSAAVKARADWVVTSTNALQIIDHLDARGEKIIWAPDRHLGRYIQEQTGADMLLWQGACVVHEEFKAQGVKALREQYPNAALLVHPESPKAIVDMADVVGSTTQLLNASKQLPNEIFIVATDRGIFYKMQQACPNKIFIEAPTAGRGATCRSCAHCPWMAMNSLENLKGALEQGLNEIYVDPAIIDRARMPLEKMLAFKL